MKLVPVLMAAAGLALSATPAASQDPDFAPSLQIDLSAMERTRGSWWKDLTIGTGPTVRQNSRITIHYVGWLADGTRFESSRDRNEPLVFRIGDGRVIRGWDDGLRGMRAGGVRRLVIPPRNAYGSRGRPPIIPPDAMLVFEVELLSIDPTN